MKSYNCIDFYLYLRYNIIMKNNIISQRLKTLRKNLGKSQAQIAELNGTVTQPAIFRYEHGLTDVPNDVLLWYADFFDVSLDYIYGRTDKPQGRLYDYVPKVIEDDKMKDFIEMCFDPKSPANAKLKEAVTKLLQEENHK